MNPLFQAMSGGMTGGNNQIATLMQMLRGGNPEQIAQQMMQSNPNFKRFMDANTLNRWRKKTVLISALL